MFAIQYYPSHPSPLKNTEIEPMLAIEYFAGLSDGHISDRRSTTTGLVADQEEVPDLKIVADPPLVGGRIPTRSPPPRKKNNTRANNYILHLYGWSTWWTRVTGVTKPNIEQNCFVRSKKAEEEKFKFLKKFYPNNTVTGKNRYEKSEEPVDWKPDGNDFKGTCTPKRLREFEEPFQMGANNEPSKKIKFEFENIRRGDCTNTDLKNISLLKLLNCDTDSENTLPDEPRLMKSGDNGRD